MSQSNRRPASSKGAPAAALLGGQKPATKIIEGETASPDAPSPAPGPEGEPVQVDKDAGELTVPTSQPMHSADSEEHGEIQRRYREHMAKVRAEEASARAESASKPAEEPAARPESPSERYEREAREAKAAYRKAVESMAEDEPVYVAGPRAKGLRSHGHLLRPGDVIPGAAQWPRLQTWLELGQVSGPVQNRKAG